MQNFQNTFKKQSSPSLSWNKRRWFTFFWKVQQKEKCCIYKKLFIPREWLKPEAKIEEDILPKQKEKAVTTLTELLSILQCIHQLWGNIFAFYCSTVCPVTVHIEHSAFKFYIYEHKQEINFQHSRQKSDWIASLARTNWKDITYYFIEWN